MVLAGAVVRLTAWHKGYNEEKSNGEKLNYGSAFLLYNAFIALGVI